MTEEPKGLQKLREKAATALWTSRKMDYRGERPARVSVSAEVLLHLLDERARVREALAGHPKVCDRHTDDDPIKCGWKRAVADVTFALDATE